MQPSYFGSRAHVLGPLPGQPPPVAPLPTLRAPGGRVRTLPVKLGAEGAPCLCPPQRTPARRRVPRASAGGGGGAALRTVLAQRQQTSFLTPPPVLRTDHFPAHTHRLAAGISVLP